MAMLDITPRRALEQVQRTLALSDRELAHILSSSPRTLNRWRSSETFPQHEARERLATPVALAEHLADTFPTEEAGHIWIDTSNRYLGGFTPADATRAGRFDRVEAALEALHSGIFI